MHKKIKNDHDLFYADQDGMCFKINKKNDRIYIMRNGTYTDVIYLAKQDDHWYFVEGIRYVKRGRDHSSVEILQLQEVKSFFSKIAFLIEQASAYS